MRVILEDGTNLGVLPLSQALAKAESLGLDLVEVTASATPPVAKIISYGKYEYLENKKQKGARSGAKPTETKSLQVKIGTGEHDLELKAKKASEFLKEGHRVRIDLYLRGRAKYMEKDFLKERLGRILNFITENYRIADGPKPSPKGIGVIIEKAK